MEVNIHLEEIAILLRQMKHLEEETIECHEEISTLLLELIGRLTYERQLRRAGSYVRIKHNFSHLKL